MSFLTILREEGYESNHYFIYAFAARSKPLTAEEVGKLKALVAEVPLNLLRYESAGGSKQLTKMEPNNNNFYSEERKIRSLADDLPDIYIFPSASIGKRQTINAVVWAEYQGELYYATIEP